MQFWVCFDQVRDLRLRVTRNVFADVKHAILGVKYFLVPVYPAGAETQVVVAALRACELVGMSKRHLKCVGYLRRKRVAGAGKRSERNSPWLVCGVII